MASEKKTEKMNYGKLLKKFLPYYRPYKKILVFDLFCAALTTLCELVLPLIVREITGRANENIASLTLEFIIKMGIIYLVLRLIDTMANYYMASIGHVMGAAMETDMRRDFFSHLQKLSFGFYDNTKIGQLMSRLTSDMFDITEFAHHCPEEVFITTIKIVGSFIILSTYNLWLTLLVFAIIPIMLVVLNYFNIRMRAGFRESRREVGELNSQVEDSLLGVRVVKSFSAEKIEEEKFDKGNVKFLGVKKKIYRYMAGYQSASRLFDGFMYIMIVVVGSIFLINEMISIADYVAYLLYISTLLSSIKVIINFAEQFQRGMTGIERFSEIMDTEPDIEDSPNAKELKVSAGNVKLDNVSFGYDSEEKKVLDKISVDIKAGTTVAIVGPSGAGKTTICNLIPRFYELNGGKIEIDGEDIRDVTMSSLRNSIGIVQQDVYLFSGSIAENIRYGTPDASDEAVREAARLAGADDFIESLPNGYDTYVGERGVKLSGGQKQRISIARVFLKNPPILILDEATSALDNESEYIVQKSLERLAKNRTTLIIAHRLTTIKNADRILVLTENGIEEDGTHDQLIEKNGLYKSLYKMYSER